MNTATNLKHRRRVHSWAFPALLPLLVAVPFLGMAAEPQGKPAAAAATANATTPDMARLIQQLEASGALDAAIDRGMLRYQQRQKAAEQAQQAALKRIQDATAGNARKVDAARDHIIGPAQAPVSVIVYTDLECPFCKRFVGTPESAVLQFKGQANIVFRNFPLDFHGEQAKRGANLAECVGQQAGSAGAWAFANEWLTQTGANGKGLPGGEAQIRALAQAAGAKDLAALEACERQPQTAERVREDMADGALAGVRGTPASVVRHNASGRSLMVSGAVASDKLEQAIKELLVP